MRRTAAIAGALLITAATLTGCGSDSSNCDYLEEELDKLGNNFDTTFSIIVRVEDALGYAESEAVGNPVWQTEVEHLQELHPKIVRRYSDLVGYGCIDSPFDPADVYPYAPYLDPDHEFYVLR